MSVKQKFIDLVLRGKDMFSPAANSASDELKKLQAESKATTEQLKNLEQQQNQIYRAQGLELYAKNTETALKAAREEVSRLAREMDAADRPTKEQGEALKLATRSANQLQTEYNKLQNQLTRAKSELQQSGIDTSRLSNEQDRLQKEIKESNSALNTKRERLRQLRGDLETTEKGTNTFGAGIAGLTTKLAALAATYFGINQLKTSITNVFKTGDQFERLGIQMTGVMGSIEEGQRATKWIEEFAVNTPLQLDQVTEAFVKLRNFGLDPMDGTLMKIIDMSEKLGGGWQKTEAISRALGEAWGKQRLQGQEILQLINAGVPVWELLEKVTGRTAAEVRKLSEAGQLGRDVMRDLIDEMGRSAEGMAKAGMQTMTGLVSNLKDQMTQFYNMIATNGALDWFKGQLTAVNQALSEMTKSGELKQIATSISNAFTSMAIATKDAVNWLISMRGAIQTVAISWAALKVGRFLGDVVDGSKAAYGGLKNIVFGAGAASKSLSQLELTAKGLFKAIGVGLLVQGVVWAVEQFGKLKDAVVDLYAAKRELEKSEQALIQTQRELNNEFEELSKQTGYQIKNIEDLIALEREGLIVYNEKIKAYESAAAAARLLEQAEREQVGTLKLTAEQAAAAASNILEMSQVYTQTEGSVDALNKQIYQVIEALKTADVAYADQIAKLEELARKNRAAGLLYEEQQKLLKDTEEAYKALGITSADALERTAAKLQAAYELIKDGEAPLEIQRQAFLKWSDSALAAARATGDVVPESLRLQAAALGLTQQFNELVKKQGLSIDLNEKQSKGFSLIQNEINKTKSAIDFYKRILDDSTFSTEEKAKATIKLYEAELLLKGQYETLAKLEKLRTANYFQLRQEYDTAQRSLDELNRNYTSGIITTEQYNQQLERQLMLIQALRGLLPDVNDNTDRNTDTQRNAGQQIQQTTTAIRDQKDSLDDLSDSTETATRYTSLLAGAQQALQQQFDFTDKSTQDLNARYSELTGWIHQNRRAHNEWWRELARASNAAFTREQQIISETKKMRDYIAQLNSASVSMRDVTRISQDLTYNFQQMGDLELAPLRQAITDAERRLLSFRDELQGTVSSLQDELDRLNNNQSAIEKRRYEQQTAELREKLKAAQQSGDNAAVAAAQKALSLAEQIYSIKQQQAAEDLKTKTELSRQQPAGTANNVSPLVRPAAAAPAPVITPASSTAQSSRTVRLVLDLQGRSYNAEMSAAEVDRMLAQIERARSTSL